MVAPYRESLIISRMGVFTQSDLNQDTPTEAPIAFDEIFANAMLLSLTESISVIMGANIGTTVTAWLITLLGFKVSMSTIALPLVGFGFAFTFAKKERLKNIGLFIIGFSLLFIGLQFLKDAMPNINENPEITIDINITYSKYLYLYRFRKSLCSHLQDQLSALQEFLL